MASEFVRKVNGIRNIDILSPNITTENDLISTIDGDVYVATNKGLRKITGVETKEIKQLKTDVSNLKIQSDTNTLNISGNTDDIDTNTSEIETLKTTINNNTSEIETLKTSTDDNTSEIETLKTSTDDNTSEIETLKTSTDDNTSEIETLKKSTDTNTSEIETLKTTINNNKVLLFDGSSSSTGDVIKLNQSYEDFTELKIKATRAHTNEIYNFDAEDDTSFVISYINVFDNNSDGKLYEMIIDKISPTELEIESQRAINISGESSDNSAITILKIWGVK